MVQWFRYGLGFRTVIDTCDDGGLTARRFTSKRARPAVLELSQGAQPLTFGGDPKVNFHYGFPLRDLALSCL